MADLFKSCSGKTRATTTDARKKAASILVTFGCASGRIMCPSQSVVRGTGDSIQMAPDCKLFVVGAPYHVRRSFPSVPAFEDETGKSQLASPDVTRGARAAFEDGTGKSPLFEAYVSKDNLGNAKEPENRASGSPFRRGVGGMLTSRAASAGSLFKTQ